LKPQRFCAIVAFYTLGFYQVKPTGYNPSVAAKKLKKV